MRGELVIGRLAQAAGAGLFAAIVAAGWVQSLRVERRAPAIDLFEAGSRNYVNGLVAQSDYDAAIAQLELQARLLPFDAEVCEHLGNLLGSRGRLAEARARFQTLVTLRPDYAEGRYFLGCSYLDMGHPILAVKELEQAIRLNPAFALAMNSLGVAQARLGELEAARECFVRAVELDPDYVEARNNLDQARRDLENRGRENSAN